MVAIRLDLRGFEGLDRALNPKRLSKQLRANLLKATRLNGKLGEAAQRKEIQGGVSPKNAALTQAIKGGDKPLVHTSALFGAITSRVQSYKKVFVGVLRNSGSFNVAVIVHDGVTIPVTPKMRGMFFALWQASEGKLDPSQLSPRAQELFDAYKGWKPLLASTTAIIIPPRPWADLAFSRPTLQAMAKENWLMAIKQTCAQIAATSKAGR